MARSPWGDLFDQMFGGAFTPTGYDYSNPQAPPPQAPPPQVMPPAPIAAPTSAMPGHMDLSWLNAPVGRVIDYAKKNPYDDNQSWFDHLSSLFTPPTVDVRPGSFAEAVLGRSGRVLGPDATTLPSGPAAAAAPGDVGGYTPIPRSSPARPYSPVTSYNIPGVTPPQGVQPLAPEQTIASAPTPPPQDVTDPFKLAAGQTGAMLPAVTQGARADASQGAPGQPQQAPSGPFDTSQDPSAFDRVSAAMHNLGGSQSFLGGLVDAIHGAATGQRMDPQGMQLAIMQNTYRAALQQGYRPDVAMMAATNPQYAMELMKPPQWTTIQKGGEYGDQMGWVYPQQFLMRPGAGGLPGAGGAVAPGGGAPFAGGAGGGYGTGAPTPPPSLLAKGTQFNDDLRGDAWINQWSPDVLSSAKAWLNGDVLPTTRSSTGFDLNKIGKKVALRYAQDMGIPFSDATFAAKRKFQTDMAAGSSGTTGGNIVNGVSAIHHLATYSDALSDLNNFSGPSVPFGGWAGEVGNIARNVVAPTPQLRAKISAARDAGLKYGQESTKYYSGTGGGEAERMEALHANNPGTSLGTEQAAFLQTERNLMLGRLKVQQDKARSLMGDQWLAQNPIMTRELQDTIARIDANIARLRGEPAQAGGGEAAPTPAGGGLPPPPAGFHIVGQ